jgi:hypothetical protein
MLTEPYCRTQYIFHLASDYSHLLAFSVPSAITTPYILTIVHSFDNQKHLPGARLIGTMAHTMKSGDKGLTGICNGGGGASAMIVEKF